MTEGMYALCRHPIYAGVITSCVGLGFVSNSPERLLTRVLMTGALSLLFWYQSDREEEVLYQKFGGAYSEWARRTPRFFPRIDAVWGDARWRGSESALGGLASVAVVIAILSFAFTPIK